MEVQQPKFEMKIGLNVLEHLGINLYSNVPSVLSEIVANAWDADATQVKIKIADDFSSIEIFDNGTGMTQSEVNERFLYVGYQRRTNQNSVTGMGRLPMGRKGIGKLSLFSIADEIEVHTAKNGQQNALKMALKDIRGAIEDNEATYRPEVVNNPDFDFQQGTKIIITAIRRRNTIRTIPALKKKIARRFGIIGSKEDFRVFVNDSEITPADRNYYDKIQFIWTYGNQKDVETQCQNLSSQVEQRPTNLENKNIDVTGWIGTVSESGQLKDHESGDNLNKIAIFVRGKMAQEDILSSFGEQGIYASYIIGEIRFDEIDADDQEDAATSNRQSFVEDDQRYILLKQFLQQELKHIQASWNSLRTTEGSKQALKIPELDEWVKSLPNTQQNIAKSWLGKIYRLRTNNEAERRQLMKYSVFAFEFHRAKENLAALEAIDDQNLQEVMSMFKELDSLEEVFYGQIVKQRVGIIQKLQEKIDNNNKERVIQEYLFDHLWLLDPHWERIESEQFMEKRISTLFSDLENSLSEEEMRARIDIKYRKTAGTHVVVELKKPGVIVSISDLIRQIEKYRSGILKLLDEQNDKNPLHFVILLGRHPREWNNPKGPETVINLLQNVDAHIVLYDELLKNAYNCYDEYLKKSKDVKSLENIIQAIDTIDADG